MSNDGSSDKLVRFFEEAKNKLKKPSVRRTASHLYICPSSLSLQVTCLTYVALTHSLTHSLTHLIIRSAVNIALGATVI